METININGKTLELHTIGGRFAYEKGTPGTCIKIVSERMHGDVKILTMCGKPLHKPAVDADIMGCMVSCHEHLEKYFQERGKTIEQTIAEKRESDRRDAAGENICSECGGSNAHWVAGEGQYLCNKCNYRTGINRWS